MKISNAIRRSLGNVWETLVQHQEILEISKMFSRPSKEHGKCINGGGGGGGEAVHIVNDMAAGFTK